MTDEYLFRAERVMVGAVVRNLRRGGATGGTGGLGGRPGSADQPYFLLNSPQLSADRKSTGQRTADRLQRPNSQKWPKRTGQDSDHRSSSRADYRVWVRTPEDASQRCHRSHERAAQIDNQHLDHPIPFAAELDPAVCLRILCAHQYWPEDDLIAGKRAGAPG